MLPLALIVQALVLSPHQPPRAANSVTQPAIAQPRSFAIVPPLMVATDSSADPTAVPLAPV
eukprot:333131-Prymnesium_polylepis.1